MRIHTASLGCRLNQSEMDDLARRLHALGHQIVTDPARADISVLNTCTVTHIASRKSRQALRRLRRANPSGHIVVTGCYAEMSPGELTDLGIDLLVGNEEKDVIVELLAQSIPGFDAGVSPPTAPYAAVASRTRAFVKIQDGCDNACTYCIVTKARGPARSRSRDEVLAEIRARLDKGYKEVVLTGVHIGCYGRDRDDTLAGIVRAILDSTDVPRLRLSSVEPWDLSTDLLACWHDPRLCRHLHLPLQSGCDATLARMARKYTTNQFAELTQLARQRIPRLAISTDVMVGFPGETQAEFEISSQFIRAQAFSRLHVFKYSVRPGTVAAGMPDQVDPRVKQSRSDVLHELGKQAARAYHETHLGRTMMVLWETEHPAREGDPAPTWSGLTDTYVRVYAASEQPLANELLPARLVSHRGDSVWAELVDEKAFDDRR